MGRRRDRAGHRTGGRRHGGGGVPRAGAERRRLLPAASGLLPARPRDLRPPRRAARLRRGDLRLRPPRPLVRGPALRLPARHHHGGQGPDLGVRAPRRHDRLGPPHGALPGAGRVLPARVHVRRAPGELRRGAGQPRRLRGRAHPAARAGDRGGVPQPPWTACWTCPIVGNVRGAGFFYGIELVKDKETRLSFDDDESEKLLRGFLSGALFEAGSDLPGRRPGRPGGAAVSAAHLRPGGDRLHRRHAARGADRSREAGGPLHHAVRWNRHRARAAWGAEKS